MDKNAEGTATILVPHGQTDWQSAGRYATRTSVEINATGHQQIADWARVMNEHKPVVLYTSPKGPSEETAQLLARELKARVKKSDQLLEVGMGLWEGLTPEQLKQRFAKTYRQWKDDPSSVCPPEGEALQQAVGRLISEIERVSAKHKGECIAVVLGPLAMSAVRCHLESKRYEAMWEVPIDRPVKYWMDLEADEVVLTS